MQQDKILDSSFNEDFQAHLFKQEKFEWQGQPIQERGITMLESEGYYDVETGLSSPAGFLFGIIACFIFIFHANGNWIGIFLTILIGFTAIVLPDILKHYRRKNTKYAFTKNRILFKLWRWGKESTHSIDLANIEKISFEELPNGSGILYFMSRIDFQFNTYDFVKGERRFHPTFEMIPDVQKVYQKLELLRRQRIKENRLMKLV